MLLYNTKTRSKETFIPQEEGHVRMYVCGITAYDLCHIGHARSAVAFDVLVRHLRKSGYKVDFARNFTDVDDKIIKRANQEGLSSSEVAEKYIAAFYEDMDRLNILRPDIEPKATEHIGDMIDLTAKLVEKGHAYPTPSGDVYFRVRSLPSYGALSGRDIEDLKSGARVEPGEEKEDPLDFALWKAAKPGEPFWDSPWGQGRPGWHIECSAMSERYLGQTLDIHGGGQDLIFPHHENERAQSEAASGQDFVKYWVHNGFVQINSEKMSKSLNNFKTIRDILENYTPEVLRFFLLAVHYRSPLDFSFQGLDEAEKALRRIYAAKALMLTETARDKWVKSPLPPELSKELEEIEQGFAKAMDDDLNTAAALGHVFNLARLAGRIQENKTWRKSESARDLWLRMLADLAAFGDELGVFGQDCEAFATELKAIRVRRKNIDEAKVAELLAGRQAARNAKDFASSDALRDELTALGVEVKDTPTGQVWDVA